MEVRQDITCVVDFLTTLFRDMGVQEQNSLIATAELLIFADRFFHSNSTVWDQTISNSTNNLQEAIGKQLLTIQTSFVIAITILIIIVVVFIVLLSASLFIYKDPRMAVFTVFVFVLILFVLHYYVKHRIASFHA